MLKNSGVNAKIARPVGSKRIEKPLKTEKSLTKHEENKEKSNNNTVAGSSKKSTTVAATKKIPSGQDASAIAKPQINSKIGVAKPKQSTATAPSIRPKITNVTTNKVIRQQPMRAIHQVQAKKPVADKNVMNTVHNVTVASPPSVRKEQTNQQNFETLPREREPSNTQVTKESLPRERTKTRTLEPEEVVILKQSKDDRKTMTVSDSNPSISAKIEQKTLIIHEPVAFEITFEKPVPSPTIDSSSKSPHDISDGGDYEDDFDSYESDFETESSSKKKSTVCESCCPSRTPLWAGNRTGRIYFPSSLVIHTFNHHDNYENVILTSRTQLFNIICFRLSFGNRKYFRSLD